jgi:hypothetical protein
MDDKTLGGLYGGRKHADYYKPYHATPRSAIERKNMEVQKERMGLDYLIEIELLESNLP